MTVRWAPARLWGRPPAPADAAVVLALHHDSRAVAHNPGDQLADSPAAQVRVGRWLRHWHEHGLGCSLLSWHDDDAVLGVCGVKHDAARDRDAGSRQGPGQLDVGDAGMFPGPPRLTTIRRARCRPARRSAHRCLTQQLDLGRGLPASPGNRRGEVVDRSAAPPNAGAVRRDDGPCRDVDASTAVRWRHGAVTPDPAALTTAPRGRGSGLDGAVPRPGRLTTGPPVTPQVNGADLRVHQPNGPSASRKLPLGPSAGSVAARTMTLAPSDGCCVPRLSFRSVAL